MENHFFERTNEKHELIFGIYEVTKKCIALEYLIWFKLI